jgi:hypothetical protein
MRFAALSLRRFILLLKDAILNGTKNVKEIEQVLSFFYTILCRWAEFIGRSTTHSLGKN